MSIAIPRGRGYDKASLKCYMRELYEDTYFQPLARRKGLNPECLAQAFMKHFPEWWEEYAEENLPPENICSGCAGVFIPSRNDQQYHSRQCASAHKRDLEYFGGKRSQTVGLTEGICQICRNNPKKGLSSHHVLGKENDPDNNLLVALCTGCHKLVTLLARRTFVSDEKVWQELIRLAWLRHRGAAEPLKVTVKIK